MDFVLGNEIFSFVIILVLSLYYFFIHRIPTIKNRIFICMLVMCIISSIINLVFAALASSTVVISHQAYSYIIALTISIQIFLASLYLLFTLTTLKFIIPNKLYKTVLYFSSAFLLIILVMTNEATNLVYQIGDNYELIRLPGYYIIYASVLLYYGISTIIVLVNYKITTTAIKVSYISIFATIITFQFLQALVFNDTRFTFPTAISLLLIILITQNPHIDTSNAIVGFNQSAFVAYIRELLRCKFKFSILVIAIHNYNDIERVIGSTYSNALLKYLYQYLRSQYNNISIFNLEDDYIAIVRTGTMIGDSTLETINKKTPRSFHIDDIHINFKPMFIGINYDVLIDHYDNLYPIISRSMSNVRKSNISDTIMIDKEKIYNSARYFNICDAINDAIEKKSVEVWYQPIIRCSDDTIYAYEALTKLYDNHLGYISPDEFITIAEQNNSILKLGEIILDNVCSFISELNRNNIRDIKIAINLSVAQCLQANLIDLILEKVNFYQISRQNIKFEITETAFAFSNKIFSETIFKLHELGFELSLDDYGTGYSTLNYVLNHPFDVIKIDKSLLKISSKYKNINSFITSTIESFHDLGLKVVFEGIETAEEYEFVKSIKSDYGQGFYFSQAIPKEKILGFKMNKTIKKG